MGGSAPKASSDPVTGIQIGTSSYGQAVPIVYGWNRLPGNVVWMPPELFLREAGSSGGKGGASAPTSDSYWQGLIIAICEGPIVGLGRVWRDKDVFESPAKVDSAHPLNVFLGARPQAPWSYLSTPFAQRKTGRFWPADGSYTIPDAGATVLSVSGPKIRMLYGQQNPNGECDIVGYTRVTGVPGPQQYRVVGQTLTWNYGGYGTNYQMSVQWQTTKSLGQVLGYGGTAYVASEKLSFGSSNSLKNLTWEVKGLLSSGADSFGNVNPAAVIQDLLTNAAYGLGWPASRVVVDVGQDGAAASSAMRYCSQAGLLLSPLIQEQKEASAHLRDILDACNCECTWSEGKLKVFPLGDAAVGTYSPAITPLYALTRADFIVSSPDDEPLSVERRSVADCFNSCPVEYLDATIGEKTSADYNVAVAEDMDQASAAEIGPRKADPVALHCITNPDVAQKVARIRAQRSIYHRNTWRFTLGWKMCLLEPLDFVTIEDDLMGLPPTLVRIMKIDEDDDLGLQIEAEEWPVGTMHAVAYKTQNGEHGGQDVGAPPGQALPPVILAPPLAATGGEPQLWLGTSGAIKDWGGAEVWISWDLGTSYELVGEVGQATYGLLTTSVPAGSPIDTSSALQVDLGPSAGVALSVSEADRDALETLCLVDGELMAWQTAGLVAGTTYQLTGLRRGCSGTTSATHTAGAQFLWVDGNVLRVPLDASRFGKAVFVKLVSFNIARRALEDPAEAPVYSYALPSRASSKPSLQLPITESFDDFSLDDWEVVQESSPGTLEVVAGAGVRGGNVLRARGMVSLIHKALIPVDPSRMLQVTARAREYQEPTTGGKGAYFGFVGVAADGVTLCNVLGNNDRFNQHYVSTVLPGDQTWLELNGYWKGLAEQGTAGGPVVAPGQLQFGVRYVRLVMYLGYDTAGDGVMDVDLLECIQTDPAAEQAASDAGAALAKALAANQAALSAASDAVAANDQAVAALGEAHDRAARDLSNALDGSVVARLIPPSIVGGGNLLLNSSFEGATYPEANGPQYGIVPEGWAMYNNDLQACTYSVESGGLYGGKFARCSWSVYNKSSRGWYSSSDLPVTGGRTGGVQGGWRRYQWYTLSFWARGSGGATACNMWFAWNLDPALKVTLSDPALTGDWQRYAFKFRWGDPSIPEGAGRLYITLNGGASDATLDIDAVQVEEGEVPTAYSERAAELTVDSIKAGMVSAGAVGTRELAANIAILGKAYITDLENLVGNTGGECGSADGWTGAVEYGGMGSGSWAGNPALRFFDRDSFYGKRFPVTPGDQFWVSYDAVASSDPSHTPDASTPFKVGVICYANATDGYNGYPLVNPGAVWNGGVQHIEGTITVPGGCYYAQVWGCIDGAWNSGKWWYARNLTVRRKNKGELIVDGAITAGKIGAGQVTTEKLGAGAVTANEIAAGAVTTAKLGAGSVTANELAAGAVTAAKILAGQLKTSNYVENSSGAPTAGAKLDHQGTALKVAPGNLQLGALPFNSLVQMGSTSFTINDSAASVILPRAYSDTNYRVMMTVRDFSGSPAANSRVVTRITKATTGFTVMLGAAPGSGNTVYWDWIVIHEFP